ncbi:hypothetical protein [Paenibacillus radicis (ex Xue et al. 2023)]|uniref:Uncharacterized protein n=1 Tax=Paenibacillus radicis (ex Xue et al. 2023) TaxID=2972489 RepID=A0ABT1YUE2_9BACL|nr:hypothetical protein [Paenibacillus radicis (ex Xue et al. 2023)]MCR8636043.1 hypothetical protein [Paenibacillus radicis (ex Xue et al. 2023)]
MQKKASPQEKTSGSQNIIHPVTAWTRMIEAWEPHGELCTERRVPLFHLPPPIWGDSGSGNSVMLADSGIYAQKQSDNGTGCSFITLFFGLFRR